jgi:hypothetical protein
MGTSAVPDTGIAGHIQGRPDTGDLRNGSGQPIPLPEVTQEAEMEIVVQRGVMVVVKPAT